MRYLLFYSLAMIAAVAAISSLAPKPLDKPTQPTFMGDYTKQIERSTGQSFQ